MYLTPFGLAVVSASTQPYEPSCGENKKPRLNRGFRFVVAGLVVAASEHRNQV